MKNYLKQNKLVKLFCFSIFTLLIFPGSFAQNPGDLDPSFGIAGKVVTQFGNFDESMSGIKVLGDGSIIGVGNTILTTYHESFVCKYNPNGTLDNTFGVSNGFTTTSIGPDRDIASAMDMHPDGRIVSGGYTYKTASDFDFALIQYLSDGTLDPSFGTGGIVTTDITTGKDQILDMVIQPDGRILVVGYGGSPRNILLARYNIDGSLDNTFGTAGIVQRDINGTSDEARSIALQDDGKIVICGTTDMGGGNSDSFVARLNSDGSFDNTFGANGFVFHDFYNHAVDVLKSCDIDDNGNIIAVGYSYSPTCVMTLIRLTPTGSLDQTFNGTGNISIIMQGTYEDPLDMKVLSNGKILITGKSHDGTQTDLFLYQMMADGSIDAGFGNNSYVLIDYNHTSEEAFCFDVSDDEKTVTISGSITFDGNVSYDIPLARVFLKQDTAQPCPPMIEDIEGNRYNTAKRDGQCWMADNMRTTKYPDNSPITKGAVTHGDASWATDQAWYSCPPNAANNGEDCAAAATLGMQYQWTAAMNGSTTEGAQGLCSDGWHVPSDTEWKNLEGFLGMTVAQQDLVDVFRGVNEGSKMAAHSKDQTWNAGPLTSDPDFGSSGFNLSPVGYRHFNGNYNSRGNSVHLWSSSDIGGAGGWERELSYTLTTVYRSETYTSEYGLSVRCLKNTEALQNEPVIITDITDITLNVGEEHNFIVNATGVAPDFVWQVNSGTGWTNVVADANYSGETSTSLSLSTVPLSFTGSLYRCIASNAYGADTSSVAQLTVNEPQAGDLDGAFGENGWSVYNYANENNYFSEVEFLDNGKILAVGTHSFSGTADGIIARYNEDGWIDSTFGINGFRTVDNFSDLDYFIDIAVQTDNKIVVAGKTLNAGVWDMLVTRFYEDGSLDNNFDGDGKATYRIGSFGNDCNGVEIDGSGNIIIAGAVKHDAENDYDHAIARILPNGTLDPTFGTGGYTITLQHPTLDDNLYDLELQADGKIVVAGKKHNGTNDDYYIARYDAAGILDGTFNTTGQRVMAIGSGNEMSQGISIASDGTIYLTGRSHNGANYDIAVVSINNDGSMNTDFNFTGIATVSPGLDDEFSESIGIQENGKIIVGGYGNFTTTGWDFMIIRYDTTGILDNSFGTNGISTMHYTQTDYTVGMALTNNNKAILAGYVHNGSLDDFALARIYLDNQSSAPTVDTDPSNLTVCDGADAAFSITASSFGITSYQWQENDGGGWSNLSDGVNYSGTDTLDLIIFGASTTFNTYLYRCIVTNIAGADTSANALLNVNSFPVPVLGGNQEICDGASLTLDPGAFDNYSWSTTATTSTITVGTEALYSVTVSDAIGCSGTDDAYVAVNATPIAAITPDPANACSGAPYSLDGNPSGGSGTYTTHAWSGSPGLSSYSTPGTIFTEAAVGTYTLTYTVTDDLGCTDYDNIDVTVYDKPTALITPDPASVCAGLSLSIAGNPSGGTGTYTNHTWTGDVAGLSSSIIANPVFSSVTAGTHNLTYTVTDNNGCSGSDIVAISVFDNPTAAITPDPAEVCPGATLPLLGTQSGGSGSYNIFEWTGETSYLSTTITPDANFSASASGSYNLSYTVTDMNGCSGTDNIVVSVLQNPTATISPDPAEVCSNEILSLTGSGAGGSGTYTTHAWSGSPGLSSYATPGTDFTESMAGNYTLTYVVTDDMGCSGSDIIDITVYDKPTALISPDPASVCAGLSLSIAGNPSGGSGIYSNHTWTGDVAGLSSSGIASPDFSSVTAGTHNLTYTVTDNNGCTGSDNISITVFDNPTAVITPDPAEVCPGATLPLLGTQSGGSGSYNIFEWTGETSYLSTTITPDADFSASASGSYNLTYTVTDMNGCSGTDNIVVSVLQNPTATISPDPAEVCSNEILSLTGSGAGGSGTYTTHAWSGSPGLSSYTTPGTDFTEAMAGSYTLTYTVTDDMGCSGSDIIDVTVYDKPTALISPDPAIVCEGATISLAGNPIGGSGTFTSHVWTGDTSPLSATGIENPDFTAGAAGTYNLLYTITDNNSCTASAAIAVTVNANPSAAITPNPAEVCEGETIALAGNPTGGSGTYTSHAWTGDTAPLSATGIENPDFTIAAAGTYSLLYTLTDNNSCTASAAITVTVNANPSAAITPDPAEVCAGSNLNLDGNPAGGSGTYTNHAWTGDISALSSASVRNPVLNSATSGTLNLTYIVTDTEGCQNSDNISVLIHDLPLPVISPDPAAVCAGDNLNLNGNPAGGSGSYTNHAWTGDTSTLSATDIVNPVLSSSSPGIFNLSYTVTDDNSCMGADTISVTVNAIDDATFSYLQTNYCQSGTDPLPDYIATPGGSFAELSGNISINPSTGQIDLNMSSVGTYTVEYITPGICPDTGQVSISIVGTPDAEFAYSDPFCEGATNPLPTHSTGIDGIYSSTAGLVFISSNTGEIDLSNSTPGTYTILNTLDIAGCSIAVDSQSVTIHTAPTVAILPNPAEICAGVILGIDGNPTAGSGAINSHSWTGDTFALNNTTTQNPQFISDTAGSFNLQYTVSDDNSCSATGNLGIEVFDNPVISLGNDTAACDGAVFTFDAGSGFVQYEWSNASSAQILTTDISGVYSVTVTDANSCLAVDTIETTLYILPTASISPDGAVICDYQDTIVNANPVPGDGSILTHTWTGNTGPLSATNTPDPVFMPANSGSYSLYYSATDEYGCSASDSIVITVNQSPVINLGNDTTICVNSSIAINAGSYTSYLWSTGESSQTINVQNADTYSVVVTDLNACEAEDTITVGIFVAPMVDLGNDIEICLGNTSILDAGNFVEYLWSDNSTTQTIEVDSSAIYSVTVIDSNTCSASDTINVFVNPFFLSNAIDSVNESCSGASDGSILITTSGGTAPYSWLWSTGSTSNLISGLSAGVYTVTASDANACFLVDDISLSIDGSVIVSTINSTPVSCFNGDDGFAMVSAIGGQLPYTYVWSNTITNASVNELNADTYFVTITDASGCFSIDSVTIEAVNTEIFITETINMATCVEGSDGSIVTTVTGGTPDAGNYSYLWSTSSTNTYIAGLAPDSYSLVVTDSLGCTVAETFSVGASTVISLQTSSISSSCGNDNGVVSANATGGQEPYQYLWSNDATGWMLQGLASGNYLVTVTDNQGCIATGYTAVEEDEVSFEATVTTNNANCQENDGSASIVVTGGAETYTFDWTNGYSSVDSSSSTADSLFAGMYMVTVTDNNGCADDFVAMISDAAGAAIAVTSTTDISCYGGSGGAIDITVSGGVPAYSFEWSNGATSEDLAGLMAGSYELNLSDANNCLSTISIQINQPNQLSVSDSTTTASCQGNDGSAAVYVTGGTQPYSYSWQSGETADAITGLSAGMYTVSITDANSCYTDYDVAVSNLGAPDLQIDLVNDAGCGVGGGSVYISVSGGNAPYSFAWSNGSTNEDLMGVVPGNYSVAVEDAAGCISTANTSVNGQLPAINPLCLITVDNTLNANKITWEKVDSLGISHYNIYKQNPYGNFIRLDSVLYNDMSEYIDSISNPMIKAYRYRISAVDSCGYEAPPSDIHKTIHLQILPGVGNEFQLTWTHSEGFSFPFYIIERYTQQSDWIVLDSIISIDHTYTDIDPPNSNAKYRVYAKKSDPCYPTSFPDKTQSGPYSQSFSNLDDNGITGDDCVSNPTVTGQITGDVVVVAGTSSTYTVDDNSANSSYAWTVTGGNITSGEGSTSVEISWLTEGTGEISVTETAADGCTGTPSTLSVTINTDISEIALLNRVRVFPNPNTGMFKIVIESGLNENLQYELFNLSGQQIYSKEIDLNYERSVLDVDISQLPKGVYTLRVKCGSFVKVEKIIRN